MPILYLRHNICSVPGCRADAVYAAHGHGFWAHNRVYYCPKHAAAVCADVVLDPLEALR